MLVSVAAVSIGPPLPHPLSLITVLLTEFPGVVWLARLATFALHSGQPSSPAPVRPRALVERGWKYPGPKWHPGELPISEVG